MTPTLSTQILKMNQLGALSRAIAYETFMKLYAEIVALLATFLQGGLL